MAGHTDNKAYLGLFKDNWGLSVMRAREVLDFLIKPEAKGGGALSPSHWSASGYGDTDPWTGNATPEGRQNNRRCELVVLPSIEEMLDLESLTSEGFRPMRVACIDIGTNSVLLLVVEADAQGQLTRARRRATITRLGQGVDRSGVLASEAVERTLACLTSYAETIREYGVERVVAVVTSAMRDARGGEQLSTRAQQLLGVRPQVISGDREAELTFEGAVTGLELQGEVAVFDVGGGSTELILGRRLGSTPRWSKRSASTSGPSRLTERHVRAIRRHPRSSRRFAARPTRRWQPRRIQGACPSWASPARSPPWPPSPSA